MKQDRLCSDQQLLALLGDKLDENSSDALFTHVSNCAHCQTRIEELAASKDDWQDVAEALKTSAFNSSGTDTVTGWTESISRQLLQPPSHPEMLGRLDRYEIERLIGIGGMGVVFKAYDSELSRPVAIKVLAPSLQHNGTARQRFAREARAAAAVVHQHVVPIHDVETSQELPYLVMHYVAGESLQARIDRQGALELKEILRIGIQIADGLSAAHQQGLVHRDIKPSNILLENANVDRALITDFGLARAVDDVQMTRTGTFLGTPRYMSPEQTRGEPIDQQSDLFSLGSVLYTMCTGQPAFAGDSPFVVMKKIGEEPSKPIQSLNPDIPEWLCAIIGKLHSKDPKSRFESSDALRDVLSGCLSHVQQPDKVALPHQSIPRQKGRAPTSASKVAFRLSAVGIAAVLLVAILLVLNPGITNKFRNNSGLTALPKVAEPNEAAPEKEDGPSAKNATVHDVLGFGFARIGNAVSCDEVSIEDANRQYTSILNEYGIRKYNLPERLANDIDVNSFRALSELYAKDKNRVYFKQTVGDSFLLFKLPAADSGSFEIVTKNLGKDKTTVWFHGGEMPGIDPKTLTVIREDHVWKDRRNVWYKSEKIEEADPATFQHVGHHYYRDDQRVFWASTPVEGADPLTFRIFEDDLPYGRDRDSVWYKRQKIEGVDPITFDVVHGQVYKDKNAVYVDSLPLEGAKTGSFRKLTDIYGPNALFSDGERHYLYLGRSFGIHRVEIVDDSLKVTREIVDWNLPVPEVVGVSEVTLTSDGWQDTKVPEEFRKNIDSVHSLFQKHFEKAWMILRDRKKPEAIEGKEESKDCPQVPKPNIA